MAKRTKAAVPEYREGASQEAILAARAIEKWSDVDECSFSLDYAYHEEHRGWIGTAAHSAFVVRGAWRRSKPWATDERLIHEAMKLMRVVTYVEDLYAIADRNASVANDGYEPRRWLRRGTPWSEYVGFAVREHIPS